MSEQQYAANYYRQITTQILIIPIHQAEMVVEYIFTSSKQQVDYLLQIGVMNIIKYSRIIRTRKLYFSFCSEVRFENNMGEGTDYSNWMLARAAGHNHSVAHLKRKHPKDRYSIHRLTSLAFMNEIMRYGSKFHLTLNEKIVLVSHFNHVLEVLGEDREKYILNINLTLEDIEKRMRNPPDLICTGTLMSCLTTMKMYYPGTWIQLVEDILANKFDEDFDELFGIVIGLDKYRDNLLLINDYLITSKDPIVMQIPVIYRNSLNVLRQFVAQNVYNLKQCRLLFQALYKVKINESFFWNSVRDWFNIYTKEQLGKKPMDEYFIMKENAIDKILHDHGIIRPRPILQELSSITFILSEFGYISWRFIEFAQDLILYAIVNGSELYKRFEQIHKEEQKEGIGEIKLNQHIKIENLEQIKNIKEMERKYRTIFINPIHIKDGFVINLLVVLSRAYGQFKQTKSKQQTAKLDEQIEKQNSTTETEQASQKGRDKPNEKVNDVYLDPRVKRWLLLQLVKPDMRFTLNQIITVERCSEFIKDSNLNIKGFIFDKLQNLKILEASFSDVVQITKLIPKQDYYRLNQIFETFLQRNHPSQILKLTKLFESEHLFPYVSEYMLRLPKAVNTHDKYFSFQENCYFLLMLLKNMSTINQAGDKSNLIMQFDGEMQQLKESLKIITYSRGFKISVNSYFHQIMDYIDVVEFFEGGRS